MPEQTAAIAFLSKPESHGLAPGTPVERVETHGAIVFLAGDRAYKLKRAVKFSYMDFSTPERRKAMCLKELAVNRRTAPDIYLGVTSIAEGRDGTLRFGSVDDPAAREHVVVMRRFDQETLFGRLCDAHRLTPELMRRLADTLADFHARAEIASGFGGADGVAPVLRQITSELERVADAPFSAAQIAAYDRLGRAMLGRVGPFLDARRDEGRVRRCHGDLHLDNVFLHDGKPTLFDAIEFEDAFACIDVLYDLAFLIMDLEFHHAGALAQALLSRYLECSGDYDGLKALPLFLSMRAGIRAHVAASRARLGGDKAGRKVAQAYLDLALRFLHPPPPRLVAIGGLSGTGKTTVARLVAPAIGPAPGAVILRSDVTRKRLMGVGETTRLPDEAYTPAVDDRVFAALGDTARRVLAAGHSAVMDAVYGRAAERAALAQIAAEAQVRFDGLWLSAEPQILVARIQARRDDASDATAQVLEKQLAGVSVPADWTTIDAAGRPEAIADRIVAGLTPEPRTRD